MLLPVGAEVPLCEEAPRLLDVCQQVLGQAAPVEVLPTLSTGAVIQPFLAEQLEEKIRMFVSYNKNKLKPKRREIKQNKYVHVVWCVQ